jgi:hypothetical protein
MVMPTLPEEEEVRMSASAKRKQVAIVVGASGESGRHRISEPKKLHDSGDLSMQAIIIDEASIDKVEAGLVGCLSHVAHAVTRDSFRGFGINE